MCLINIDWDDFNLFKSSKHVLYGSPNFLLNILLIFNSVLKPGDNLIG